MEKCPFTQTLDGKPIERTNTAGLSQEQKDGAELVNRDLAAMGMRPQPGGSFLRTKTFTPNPPEVRP
jgi:hypothetical protein